MNFKTTFILGLSFFGSLFTSLGNEVKPVSAIKGLPAKIAFGSCCKQKKPHPILYKVVAHKPDLFVYLGDNIYGDTKDMKVLQKKYDELGAKAEFQNLRKNVAVVATWDDHDYGLNDSGKEYPMKEESKNVFLNFWKEPKDTVRWKRPGIYTHHTFMQNGKVMQVIILDTRTFRDKLLRNKNRKNPEPPFKHDYRPDPSPEKSILGDAQWKWLEERFKEKADLRLICSSNQFSHEYNGYESWTNLPLEQKKMTDLIKKHKANGALFISGDVHWGEISKFPVKDCYPVFDVTSSGLTETWKTIEDNKYRIGKPCRTNNFGMISIDWSKVDPAITLQVRSGDDIVISEQKLKLSEISF